jgi:sugar porter (SP) family MFS transporter
LQVNKIKEEHKLRLNKKLIFFFGALGGLLFGYDTGVIAGAQLFIQNDFKLNAAQIGFVVSCVLIGAVVGAAAISPLSDKYGRKKMVIVTSLIFCLGALGSGFATGEMSLNIARLVLGVAVGGASALVPMYLAELAPANQRGSLSALNQLMIMIGMLIAYICNYVWSTSPIGWRLMLGFAVVPAAILFVGGILLPESPRFLVKNGKEKEAREVLECILPASEIETEISDIKVQTSIESGGIKEVFSGWVRPALVVALGLAFLQQFMGCNSVFYYAPRIMMQGGTDEATSMKVQILLGAFYVVVTAVAAIFMDRFKRRTVLGIGAVGMGVSFFALAGAFSLEANKTSFHTLTFFFIACYICFFCATWGPVMWVMVGEVFPLKIRGLAVGIASLVNWGANWAVSAYFPWMLESFGPQTVFISFGVFCLIATLFVKFFVFETRGISLERIESALEKGTTKELNKL